MSLALLAGLAGAISVIAMRLKEAKLATVELPVMTKSGEAQARRARRSD